MNRLRTRLRGYRAASASNPWTDALALITSTKGWALDPSTASSLWDNSGRTVPIGSPPAFIAAADNVANTAAYLAQATGTSEPGWNGLSLEFDALDDSLNADATFPSAIQSWLNDVPGWTICVKFRLSTLATISNLFACNPGLASLDALTTGNIRVVARRLSGDAASTFTTTGLGLVTATDYLVTAWVDYTTGNPGLRVNGSAVTLSGTPTTLGNTAAVDLTALRMGRTLANTNPFGGRVGRLIALPYVASAGQIATLEAGVNATALI